MIALQDVQAALLQVTAQAVIVDIIYQMEVVILVRQIVQVATGIALKDVLYVVVAIVVIISKEMLVIRVANLSEANV